MPDDALRGPSKDPDDLPLPDFATFIRLQSEALTAPPDAADWGALVAGLRWATEVTRRGMEAANAPPGTTGARITLKAVVLFLEKQDCVMRHCAGLPLVGLLAAITDLAQTKDVGADASNATTSQTSRAGMTNREPKIVSPAASDGSP